MRISAIINETCQKFGIDYTSKYINGKDWKKDVNKLSNIYLTIKTIIGDLTEIENKYVGINGLSHIFEEDIKKLEKIDHDLMVEAILLSKREDK
jgi:hypothetical protein